MRALISLVAASVLVLGTADVPTAVPAMTATENGADEPPPVACKDLPGTTWEIRSLEGLPASADRTTGEGDGKTARAPNLIFGNGRGTWIEVGGSRESFAWLCDDTGLTITRSGKPLKMPREPGGFRYAGSPVRQFVARKP